MSNLTTVSLGIKLSVRSGVECVDPTLLPSIVKSVTISQSFQVATATVLIFDDLITIDKEARHFWKVPRRQVDFIYFANRYIGILGAVSNLFWNVYGVDLTLCNFAQWSFDIANWMTMILIDYILTIRVLALYSRDRKLSICLYTLLALEATFRLGLAIYMNVFQHVAVGELAKGVTACGIANIPLWQWGLIDWTVPLVYGLVLMALALYKAAEYWRMSAGFKGFTLVNVLIEDQVMYFVLVISVSVFAILQFKVRPSNNIVAGILNALASPSFLCVLGSRMLFNLKEAGERGQNEGTSYRSPSGTISGVEFAEPVNSNPEECQSEDAAGQEHDSAHAAQA